MPTATAAVIGGQDIDPTPFLDDPRDHRRNRLPLGDIPMALPPAVSISATVFAAVISFASALNSNAG
jgi:hypothetical protein